MTKARKARHPFRFTVELPDGSHKMITWWAKVRPATKPVQLLLRADHVKKSIELGGAGHTMDCPMAICTVAQAIYFPHPVVGYVDWQYRTAFVASKLNKNGLPTECFAYDHRDSVAQLNDSKDGQRKLLAQLQAHGDRWVYLQAARSPVRNTPAGPNAGPHTGRRIAKRLGAGAKLRAATFRLGAELAERARTE